MKKTEKKHVDIFIIVVVTFINCGNFRLECQARALKSPSLDGRRRADWLEFIGQDSIRRKENKIPPVQLFIDNRNYNNNRSTVATRFPIEKGGKKNGE